MSEKLKSCPLCGAECRTISWEDYDEHGCIFGSIYVVTCNEESCPNSIRTMRNPDRALERHNALPRKEDFAARIAELEAEVKLSLSERTDWRVVGEDFENLPQIGQTVLLRTIGSITVVQRVNTPDGESGHWWHNGYRWYSAHPTDGWLPINKENVSEI